MALMTCAGADVGADVLRARIHVPERGTWWAPLALDTATAPSGSVTLAAAGGLSLKGFVAVAGVFCDVAELQLVGGAGGLGKLVSPASYQNALLRDPLGAILKDAGESLSATTSANVLAVELRGWTVVAQDAAAAIDALCAAASKVLGNSITWRVLSDGTIWLGEESWPSQQLPRGADVLEVFPGEGRHVIGVETPALLPGVNVAGIGKVLAVDHWLTHDEVRTWAWV